jgi:Tfp pilus assembly protein FimT
MKTGMTLIELIICVMFITVLGLIIAGAVSGNFGTQTELSYGVNGAMETRCAGGYKVVVGQTGHPIQLLDAQGHGVPCSQSKLER